MNKLPFFKSNSIDDIVAWRNGKAISRLTLINHVFNLIEILPDYRFVINECQDRYAFLVGYLASLYRNQINLFPSSHSPRMFESIRTNYPELYCLVDQQSIIEDIPSYYLSIDDLSINKNLSTTNDNIYIADNQLVAIAFTSGSTGEPKPYKKYWGKHLHEALVAGDSLPLTHTQQQCVVASVPPQHMYGFITSIMMPAQHGLVMHADKPFYAEDIKNTLDKCAYPAILVTTPIQLRNCIMETTNLCNLDFILSSAAPLDIKLAVQAEKQYGVDVFEFYGSTETGAIANRSPTQTDSWTCFQSVSVESHADGLLVHGTQLPESRVINDEVHIINTHEFRLLGRNSDILKIAGNRASLSDLNLRLLEIPGVHDGVIFNTSEDQNNVVRLSALVVSTSLSKSELVNELRNRVDPAFIPRYIKFVDYLPRNKTGKLPRKDLLDYYNQLNKQNENKHSCVTSEF